MIELIDVYKTYGEGHAQVRALVDINEKIQAGEHVAIVGPSGSGKSTLLNVIGCLDRPSSGELWLDGRNVCDLDEGEYSDLRRDVLGFVFQSYHLVPRLDAAANVELPLMFAGVPKEERRFRRRQALHAVGMTNRAHHRPAQLSGGERQRVAIARATILRPKVLLADEPTGNLDRASGGQVLELLEELNRNGLTLLVVTHDPSVAQRANRILVLEDGRIAQRLLASEIHQVRWFQEAARP